MAFHDIHELDNVNAEGSAFLINDLTYLKDDMFLPIDKLKSIGKTCSSEGFNNIGWISKDSTRTKRIWVLFTTKRRTL
jgi:hypothetical protein